MEMRLAIVDDDIGVRKMLRRVIEEAGLGYVVMECGDGIQAEKILRKSQPDIALVDWLLPGQDGVELIQKLSAANLPISYIMISQVNSEPMITRAYESGIEFFIHKPINVLETRSVIDRVKESRELRQFITYVHKTASQFSDKNSPEVVDGAQYRSTIYCIFSDLGMLGEAGAKHIYALIELIIFMHQQNNDMSYQLNELYNQLAEKLNQDAKTIEQRIRRAILKGMQNVANIGLDDYYNKKFQTYSTSLFDFKEVRQEINYINGRSQYHGKTSVKKFIEGVMFIAGQRPDTRSSE